MADLDQSGGFSQYARTYLGPTVGWVMLPVVPETFVTTGPTYNVQPFDSLVLLNATGTPVILVNLPEVSAWVRAPFQRVQSPFARSLWIKDYAGLAAANPIVIDGNGAQTIDGLATSTMISNHALIRLYPLSNLTGWIVG